MVRYRAGVRSFLDVVPEAEFGGKWLQASLGAGQPGQCASAGVMGEQRNRDAQRYLAAPVRLNPVQEITAARRIQALADLAECVQQGVGVAAAGCLAAIPAQNSSR